MPSASPHAATRQVSPRLLPVLRALDRHRRLVAAIAAAVAVVASLLTLRPPPPPSVPVVVAAHDLPGGQLLQAEDLTLMAWPGADPPAGGLTRVSAAAGRLLAAPVRASEPVTDVRLVGSGLSSSLDPGQVAVPVPIADAGAAALLHPGDRIDVLAATAVGQATAALDPVDPVGSPASVQARTVAYDVLVLSVADPAAGSAPYDAGGPPLVVLAVDVPTARDLAAAAASARLSVALRPVDLGQ